MTWPAQGKLTISEYDAKQPTLGWPLAQEDPFRSSGSSRIKIPMACGRWETWVCRRTIGFYLVLMDWPMHVDADKKFSGQIWQLLEYDMHPTVDCP